jgi:hypothetical protein
MPDVRHRAAQVGWVALFALLLTWPMVYNGFPLVFSDTGAYLTSGIERFVPGDRPVFYGAFLAATSRLAGLSFTVIVQALFVAYVARLFLMWAAPHAPRSTLGLAFLAVALLTPVAWLASWLMPDVFGSLVVLAAILFVLAFEDLRFLQRVLLAIILLIALVTHTGNLLLFGGVVVATALVGSLFKLRICWRGVASAILIALLAAFLVMLSNALAHGRWTINPGSQAFLAARLVGDGFMKPFLERHCPSEPSLPLCPERDRLQGMTNNNFLWDKPSLADSTGAWNRRAADYRALNTRVMQDSAGPILAAAAGNTLELLSRSQFGADPLDPNLQSYASEAAPTRRRIERYFPGELPRFLAARQQTEQLHLTAINRLHLWWTWISYALLAAAAVAAIRARNRRALVLVAVVAIALVLNAGVHGPLSGVYTRYQVKVTWLATLTAFAVMIALSRRARTPKTPHEGHAAALD